MEKLFRMLCQNIGQLDLIRADDPFDFLQSHSVSYAGFKRLQGGEDERGLYGQAAPLKT